jgi:hypothetical protein
MANPNRKNITLTIDELRDADENQEGFCTACGFRRECCEPDARNYECDACGAHQVFGAQELILAGSYCR